MIRAALIPAVLTGVFCALFAGIIDLVTNALDMATIVIFAFISGFCGSLFARIVLRVTGSEDQT